MVRKLPAEKIKIARRLRSETTMTWSGLCGAMSAPTMKRATCESSRLNPSDADAACAACACITYNSVSMFRTDPFAAVVQAIEFFQSGTGRDQQRVNLRGEHAVSVGGP